MKDQPADPDGSDFSLIRGGPWYWLQLWLRLVTRDSLRVVPRATLFVILTWAPLAILTAVAGSFYQLAGGVSFFQDIAIHVRLLIAMPVLVLAEAPLERYVGAVVRHLRVSGTVGPDRMGHLDGAIRRTHRLRDSWIVAIAIVGLALLGTWTRFTQVDPQMETWYSSGLAGGHHLQPAGLWGAFAATPLFLTILLRSLWRFVLWTSFLVSLSRTPLQLSPGHPDRMGGLGGLQIGQQPFAWVFFALGAMFSATIANLVLHTGAQILDFKMLAVSLVVLAVLVYAAPLLAFAPQMIVSKRMGLLDYEHLSGNYTRGFERKWMGPGEAPAENLLGTADIQSMADIGNSFERVQRMVIVPLDHRTVLTPALAVGVPLLPLALMVMPLSDLLKLLMKAVL